VNSVVALIGVAGEKAAPSEPAAAPSTEPKVSSQADGSAQDKPAAPVAAAPAPAAPVAAAPAAPANDLETRLRTKSSPVVRNIAKEHGIDIRELNGTGISGRVTKKDILAFVESGGAAKAAPAQLSSEPRGFSPGDKQPSVPAAKSVFTPGENVRIEPMGIMRKKIAEHMVSSIRTSPHVYSAYEVDFGKIDEIRK